LRGILKLAPPQHLQPAPRPAASAENFLASPGAILAERADIAGKHRTDRGDSAPQSGQFAGI
jgi:hypothetical protein